MANTTPDPAAVAKWTAYYAAQAARAEAGIASHPAAQAATQAARAAAAWWPVAR